MFKSRSKLVFILLSSCLFLILFGFFISQLTQLKNKVNSSEHISITTDWDGAKVKKEDLILGCTVGQDCIPSIDNPKFETIEQADTWLLGSDTVFGVNYNGEQKAYPQRIMNWHEIVNDEIANEPIAVTFCPLCNIGVSFIRKVNDKPAQFGVSGYLYNSDLIMYDRNEGNLWQQATATAIVGAAARRNEQLKTISTTTTTYDLWKQKYPNTLVLSRDTGIARDYSKYPYGEYSTNEKIKFDVQNYDKSIHPKTDVLGIILDNGESRAYIVEDLIESISPEQYIIDQTDTVTIKVTRTLANEFIFEDISNGIELIPLRGYWFSWYAFNPNTQVFKVDNSNLLK